MYEKVSEDKSVDHVFTFVFINLIDYLNNWYADSPDVLKYPNKM